MRENEFTSYQRPDTDRGLLRHTLVRLIVRKEYRQERHVIEQEIDLWICGFAGIRNDMEIGCKLWRSC
jgi:hypothetical protein